MHTWQTVGCVSCRMILRRRCRASWEGRIVLSSTTCTNTARCHSHAASAAFVDTAVCSTTCRKDKKRPHLLVSLRWEAKYYTRLRSSLFKDVLQYCQVCHSRAASAALVDIALWSIACTNNVRCCSHAASAAFDNVKLSVDTALCAISYTNFGRCHLHAASPALAGIALCSITCTGVLHTGCLRWSGSTSSTQTLHAIHVTLATASGSTSLLHLATVLYVCNMSLCFAAQKYAANASETLLVVWVVNPNRILHEVSTSTCLTYWFCHTGFAVNDKMLCVM